MLNIKKYINKHEVQFCVENIDSSLFVKLNGRYKESNMSNHILFEITDGRFISENKYNAAVNKFFKLLAARYISFRFKHN